MRKPLAWIAATLLVVFGAACGDPTFPCGAFTFTGTGNNNAGADIVVNFDFDPATCGANCNCNKIAYIQIIRVIDRDTGDFLQPHSDQTNRMVLGDPNATQNGWAVDRLQFKLWGYYGRNDNGTFAGTLTPGSNTTVATLRDSPGGWPSNSWFDAVSVPVCIDSGATCNNQLLGDYYWLFTVSNSGVGSDPFNEVGVTWMEDAFDKAVVEWNNDAAGLGQHAFPAMTRL